LFIQVHCAAASGNVFLLRWLVQQRYCPTRDLATGLPLLTAEGHSVLALAAQRADGPMVRYIVHDLGGRVTEIKDLLSAQRALHAVLEVSIFNYFK
jgi:hypothetical protein